jgi:phosphate transport system substrate-binding protein
MLGTGAAGLTALAGCTQNTAQTTTAGAGGLSGSIVIKGSSTVFPISRRLAEAFREEHPDVNPTVDSTGTGGGFKNHFCPGDSDLNGASRPIKQSETEQCSSNGVEPVEFQIAGDALTMAVNNEAEWVDCMTFDELSQIWRDDGAQLWSDVRDDWPDEPLTLFGPASTSGTYDWFNENVVGEDREHTADHQPTEEDSTIVQGIEDNPYSMGYFGYAYYNGNSDRVKAVEIEAEAGDGCTAPSLDNAKDGSYPMARPLFIYAAKSSLESELVYEFLEFYLTKAETDVIKDIGYVPSSQDQRDENLETLKTAAGK